jgi:hypothetical protein
VPRIDDRFLDCSVYLYPTEDAARRGERIGGSGFLVAVPGSDDGWLLERPCPREGIHHLYVVSNRHLLRGPDHDFRPKPVVRLNTRDGGFAVIDATLGDWVCSDDHDLAVLPIPYREHHRFLSVSTDSFLTRQTAARHDVGIGDEVFMVGRFVSHDGKQRNLPSVRFGHISMMPSASERGRHPSNLSGEQEGFLVEVHSVSGYSGSPVFVRPFPAPKLPVWSSTNTAVSEVRIYPEGLAASPLQRGPWLLGVEWGYVHNHDQRQNNTGMSGVVPAWFLRDLLDTDRLRALRRTEQEAETG